MGQIDKLFVTIRGSSEVFEGADVSQRESVWHWSQHHEAGGADATTFGFVTEGECELRLGGSMHQLNRGWYFSAVGAFEIHGGEGMLISVPGYVGLNTIGGPVERRGRLKYIDGCTDTLLLSPVRFGDPCLNALYFPPRTAQTTHTHPSIRLGSVLWGRGICRTDNGDYPLEPGVSFCLPAGLPHSFHTEGDELAVIAYHPDSDFGPRDEDHPMLNRTIVEGVSASLLPALQTR